MPNGCCERRTDFIGGIRFCASAAPARRVIRVTRLMPSRTPTESLTLLDEARENRPAARQVTIVAVPTEVADNNYAIQPALRRALARARPRRGRTRSSPVCRSHASSPRCARGARDRTRTCCRDRSRRRAAANRLSGWTVDVPGAARAGWHAGEALFLGDSKRADPSITTRSGGAMRRLCSSRIRVLEGAQAGLSWATVLRKRALRALPSFDPLAVSRMRPATLGFAHDPASSATARRFSRPSATRGHCEFAPEFISFDAYL